MIEVSSLTECYGGFAASLVLIGGLSAVVWWLGRSFERLDLSTEVPQS